MRSAERSKRYFHGEGFGMNSLSQNLTVLPAPPKGELLAALGKVFDSIAKCAALPEALPLGELARSA